MKNVIFGLFFFSSIFAQAGISGHSYVVTGTQRSQENCDKTASAMYRFYKEHSPGEDPGFHFQMETVCIRMQAGTFFEIQLLIEPRNEREIEVVEKYVAPRMFADIYGMKLEMKRVKYFMKHVLLQYRKYKGFDQDSEIKAEHQINQMFSSNEDVKADLRQMSLIFSGADWGQFYEYLIPLVGEDRIGMTRYYSAKRSTQIAGLTEVYWITEDDQIHRELGVRHVYRRCEDFESDGRCR